MLFPRFNLTRHSEAGAWEDYPCILRAMNDFDTIFMKCTFSKHFHFCPVFWVHWKWHVLSEYLFVYLMEKELIILSMKTWTGNLCFFVHWCFSDITDETQLALTLSLFLSPLIFHSGWASSEPSFTMYLCDWYWAQFGQPHHHNLRIQVTRTQ